MPTPPKPFTVISNEKKSHRTKKELQQRKESEESLLTGVNMRESQECKSNPVAHKEFLRLKKLLKNIQKNDAIYERVINRYCIITAECQHLESERMKFLEIIDELVDEFPEVEEATLKIDFARQIANLHAQIMRLDTTLHKKRKMLFDLERDNVMTIAAALRSIPKKETDKVDPLLEALRR